MPLQMGEKLTLNIHGEERKATITRQLGEGGFSFCFLADITSTTSTSSSDPNDNNDHAAQSSDRQRQQSPVDEVDFVVLKVTSIHSREARDIALKEAALLQRLGHPNIIKLLDVVHRNTKQNSIMSNINIFSSSNNETSSSATNNAASGLLSWNNTSGMMNMLVLEYCNGGTAMDVVHRLHSSGQRFQSLQQLIIIFGQIANAVTYLHAQKPPIVHRDLKLENVLVHIDETSNCSAKGPVTTYKLCDFGSAIIGHVPLGTATAKANAEEVIEMTTTQIYRAPEMVDLYMAPKLTEKTDVWALGCCLYTLAFCQNCFEEKSNLAILSNNYKIPEKHPFGKGLEELISRMLTVDPDERADMPEIIMCLSALYASKPLPVRRTRNRKKKKQQSEEQQASDSRTGTFRTDGQGLHTSSHKDFKKRVTAKTLNPNSAAARRREKKLAEKQHQQRNQNTSPAPQAQSLFDTDSTEAGNFDSFFKENAFSTNFSSLSIVDGSGNDKADRNNDDDFDLSPTKGFNAMQDDIFSSRIEQSMQKQETELLSVDATFDAFNDSSFGGMEENSQAQRTSVILGENAVEFDGSSSFPSFGGKGTFSSSGCENDDEQLLDSLKSDEKALTGIFT
mmetsp:Transcript_26439/g.40955  ORF Transcript_26439/g.40955 Transcript_26439/m.40955 type:complete len:620 (+) Transcript_26439:112-1971(+)|eukprot:CAMPEP_0196807106 /NCGR_PEP_ID=MMETSP1362-20130617/7048_1 /TAXON_ID=163516 /ORGANISM="Leptocylindrus danicus, Strain CCMP1856" /LENGTH=619 /DNA_ID=CAMNT_0042180871 /DNA_START=44 /DNA_END=1903 /DNA_ORIENTATION=-